MSVEDVVSAGYGFGGERVMAWLAWIVGLVALVAVYAGVTTTDEVTDAGVMVGNAFVLDQPVRPYTNVSKASVAPG